MIRWMRRHRTMIGVNTVAIFAAAFAFTGNIYALGLAMAGFAALVWMLVYGEKKRDEEEGEQPWEEDWFDHSSEDDEW
jgi:hypothetical protein